MLLKRLAIDRFGIWHNWEVEDIPRGLAVFFGPNETGKSTILEFVRGMFFGLAARSRFLLGEQGDIGGTLVLEHLGREVRLSRHWSQDEGERVQVVVDGQPVLPEELMRVLCPVDEATFNAVFALGLEDLAYLRTLEEGETAKLLYELSLGADRAVLWRVLTNLHQRLAQDQDDTELKELEAERARLVRTTEEAGLETRQYVRWRVTQRKLQAERQTVMQRLDSQQREQQRCEAVLDLLPKWQQYREMRLQWKRLGPSRRISEKALRKLDRWKERMTAAKHNLAEAREALGQYDEALAGLPVDPVVLEHAAEIEALRLHRDEMVACKERLEELNRRQQELLQARSALWEGLASVTQIGNISTPNDG
ncbi:MAG TPA: AAA family ATPase, partial [Thermogutta sp.]|nr:AAA family ATPase [Thermogutta sp.]